MKTTLIAVEPALTQQLAEFFSTKGYWCETAHHYQQTHDKLYARSYDCILLDAVLPGGSGLELLKELRKTQRKDPVIILSAKGTIEDRIEALTQGADDCLPKPLHLEKLYARMEALLQKRDLEQNEILTAGNVQIHPATQMVLIKGNTLAMLPEEYKMLHLLMTEPGKLFSYTTIARGRTGDGRIDRFFREKIDGLITAVDKKIRQHGADLFIETIPGEGFRIKQRT